MEHGGSEPVMHPSHMEMTMKTEVEEAAPATTYVDIEIDVNHLKQEPVEDSRQGTDEQQGVAATSTCAIVNRTSVSTDNVEQEHLLHVKEELEDKDLEILTTVLQHLDSHFQTDQMKQKNTIRNVNPEEILSRTGDDQILCSQVRESRGKGSSSSKQGYRCNVCLKIFNSKCFLSQHIKLVHGIESHKCTQCDKEFKRKEYLSRHVKNTHSKEQYQCDICKKMCKSRRALLEHISCSHRKRTADSSSQQRYTCNNCLKVFMSKTHIYQHITTVHGTESHKCTLCNKEFKCKEYLSQHVHNTHSKQYVCDICKKMCKSRGALRGHVSKFHRNGSAGAKMEHRASEPVMDQAHMEMTMKTEVGEAAPSVAYVDNEVGLIDVNHLKQEPVLAQLVKSESALSVQEESPEDSLQYSSSKQRYTCKNCLKVLTSKVNLYQHIKTVHGTESHKCTLCYKEFKCKEYLLKHVQYSHSKQQYECDICKKMCKSRGALYAHVSIFHRNKPVGAKMEHRASEPVMDQAHMEMTIKREVEEAAPPIAYVEIDVNRLKQEPVLAQLVKSEPALSVQEKSPEDSSQYSSSKRRYKCNNCLKVLMSKSILYQHIKKVHGTESHKCTLCNKEFKCKKYLSHHVQYTHSKRQYEYDICKKMCKSLGTLRAHVSIFHRNCSAANSSEQQFECAICKRVFKSKQALTLHRSRMHKPAVQDITYSGT